MSEHESAQASGAEKKKSSGRTFLLLAILGLLVCGLIYDRKVARPAVDADYAKLDKLTQKSIFSITERAEGEKDEQLTTEVIQKALDRSPTTIFDDGDDTVEVYTYQSGLPFRTHKLYVAYVEREGTKVYYRHAKYKYDKKSDVMTTESSVVNIDPDDDSEDDSYAEGFDGGGGGGGPGGGGAGGPGGPGGPGGGGLDPEAMFAERDADGNGKLTGDEISERMQGNLAEIDTDGDGAISQEELMARMEARRGQGGRGGGADSGGGPRGRPELEEDSETPETETEPEEGEPEETEPEEAAAE